jgi:hypothetical protein
MITASSAIFYVPKRFIPLLKYKMMHPSRAPNTVLGFPRSNTVRWELMIDAESISMPARSKHILFWTLVVAE